MMQDERDAITGIISLCLLAGMAWAIIAFWNEGIWPTLAEIHDALLGPPDAVETKRRLISVDDCLAKAVATQPPARPLPPLVDDLSGICAYEIASARLGLIAGGKSEEVAANTIYYSHIQPAALRAKPQ